MQIIVTIKNFDNNLKQFDFLIPSIKSAMENVIKQLATLEEPYININNLVAVHFTENYKEELFAFQESIGQHAFTTKNKIAEGHAQVVATEDGYHIFFSKLIPMFIVIGQFLENNSDKIDIDNLNQIILEKKNLLRVIRHELAHVEDEDNQESWPWFKHAFDEYNLQSILRFDAHRLWEEYYACRRSNYFYDLDGISEEINNLLSSLDKAEKEICDLRWKYNTNEIDLDIFIRLLHEYSRSAFIYCCYFMGHTDRVADDLMDKIIQTEYPSRFFHLIPDMWKALKSMVRVYPQWDNPEIYDELSSIVLHCIESFEIYPRETDEGVYYDIPPKKLMPKKEMSKEVRS